MFYEQSYELTDYLPIEAGAETSYIKHLWGAFEILMSTDEPISAFSILPFHLLFMFAVQYKVHRISAYDKKQYLTTLSTCWLYDEGHKEVLQLNPPIPDIHGNVLGASSVRNLSFIPEKNLFSFMRIVGAGEETILKAIELVKIRSSYAHANGNIEENIEERIDDYLMVLQEFQSRMCPINDVLASKWKGEIEPEEKKESFVDTRLVSEFLCEADFNNGKLKKYFPRT